MTLPSLVSLVTQNLARSKKNFVMSGIGIVVGISSFVFFIGLAEGVRQVVLGRIFIVDQVEVVQAKFEFGMQGRPLDESSVESLQKLPGVKHAYPKMKFTFPSRGFGRLLDREVWLEVIADGIEPELLGKQRTEVPEFRDWDAGDVACKVQAECPDGRVCAAGKCTREACEYDKDTHLSVCPGDSYCAEDTDRCETPMPVLVHPNLLEIYNGSLATAHSQGRTRMPKLNREMVMGLGLNVTLGKSLLGRSDRARPLTRRVKLVGFSDKAINLGVTLPIGYVRRFNERFSGEESAATYHSVVLKLRDQTLVPGVVKAVTEMGYTIAESTERAEQAADIIQTVKAVFALVSFVIVGIAAINISQMFFMIIYQRKREIGVLRAVGASRNDVRALILGEAVVIGLFWGIAGAAAGFGASRAADAIAARLPDFPYKPDTFFAFPTWLWFWATGMAVAFCLVGAFFPANAAARQEPAAALTE